MDADILNRFIVSMMEKVPCSCMPHRGGTLFSFHWDTCRWSVIRDVVDVIIESSGIPREQIDDIPLRMEEDQL